jgi:hypothetical protein
MPQIFRCTAGGKKPEEFFPMLKRFAHAKSLNFDALSAY